MKIASFNVNSLRARVPVVLEWLERCRPDVLCVQETKVQDADFPAEPFTQIGYKCGFKGQKSYNGVAIFSLAEQKNVKFGLDEPPIDQPRLISAKINGINIVNTYIPQGYEIDTDKFQYKLDWFGHLRKYFQKNFKPTDSVIWLGDLNVAPTEIDVYEPEKKMDNVCFCPQVRKAMEDVMQWGFIDVFRKHCSLAGQYTFWDYRIPAAVKRNLGWRLDHIMATAPLAKKCTSCYIDKEPRLKEKPSDHTPIVAEFKL